MTEGVGYSAYSPVNGAFPPGRAGRFNTEHRVPFHDRVFSLLGTAIRVQPGGWDVADWVSRICYHARSHGEAAVPSKTAFPNAGTPVRLTTEDNPIKLTRVSTA